MRAAGFKLKRELAERALRQLVEAVQLAGRPGTELLFPHPESLTALRGSLAADHALVAVAGKTALVLTSTDVRRAELDTLRLRHVVLLDLRATITAESVVRVPSASEYMRLRGRRDKSDVVVLDHPPTARELRELFGSGSLRILAPHVVVSEADVSRLRKRVADGERIRLPATSNWSWFGRSG